jgi:GNAT superfamily N-acetyltransferase
MVRADDPATCTTRLIFACARNSELILITLHSCGRQGRIRPAGTIRRLYNRCFMHIRAFLPEDEAAVIRLWEQCGLTRSWNDPKKDIARKLTVQPELFLVGTDGDAIVATAMAGFDGHRGSVYYLAVAPGRRRQSLGRQIMREIERRLTGLGCPKLNILVRASNAEVADFYRKLGYATDEVMSFGKRLIPD